MQHLARSAAGERELAALSDPQLLIAALQSPYRSAYLARWAALAAAEGADGAAPGGAAVDGRAAGAGAPEQGQALVDAAVALRVNAQRMRVPRGSDGAPIAHEVLAPLLVAAHMLSVARFLAEPPVAQPGQLEPLLESVKQQLLPFAAPGGRGAAPPRAGSDGAEAEAEAEAHEPQRAAERAPEREAGRDGPTAHDVPAAFGVALALNLARLYHARGDRSSSIRVPFASTPPPDILVCLFGSFLSRGD
jgi:hypothetical protein